jgi:hypothetical protein
MTREDILKTFLEEPLLIEKKHLAPDKVNTTSFIEPTSSKLIEVMKMAINGNVDQESDSLTARKINQYLNK